MRENAKVSRSEYLRGKNCTYPKDTIKSSRLDEKRHDLLDPCLRVALTELLFDALSMLPVI